MIHLSDVDQIKLILFVPDPAKVNVSPSQILTSNPALAVGPGAIVKIISSETSPHGLLPEAVIVKTTDPFKISLIPEYTQD